MKLKRLPRYSPFLHPAKNPISTWKSSFKTQLNARQHKIINITNEITLVAYRFRLIGEILESSNGSIGRKIPFLGATCFHVPSYVLAKGQYTVLTFAILNYTVWIIISIYVSLEFPFMHCFTISFHWISYLFNLNLTFVSPEMQMV